LLNGPGPLCSPQVALSRTTLPSTVVKLAGRNSTQSSFNLVAVRGRSLSRSYATPQPGRALQAPPTRPPAAAPPCALLALPGRSGRRSSPLASPACRPAGSPSPVGDAERLHAGDARGRQRRHLPLPRLLGHQVLQLAALAALGAAAAVHDLRAAGAAACHLESALPSRLAGTA
jgi:hypothetical protein